MDELTASELESIGGGPASAGSGGSANAGTTQNSASTARTKARIPTSDIPIQPVSRPWGNTVNGYAKKGQHIGNRQ